MILVPVEVARSISIAMGRRRKNILVRIKKPFRKSVTVFLIAVTFLKFKTFEKLGAKKESKGRPSHRFEYREVRFGNFWQKKDCATFLTFALSLTQPNI